MGRPIASIDKERLRPGLAVESARGDHGDGNHTRGRETGTRVHDVAIDFAVGREELLIASRGGHGLVWGCCAW